MSPSWLKLVYAQRFPNMSSVDTENVTAQSVDAENVTVHECSCGHVMAVISTDGEAPFTRSAFWDDPKLTHFEKIGLELDKVLARPRAASPARQPSSGSKRRRRRKRVRSKSEAKRRAEGFRRQMEDGIAYSDSGSGDTLDCVPLGPPLAERSADARFYSW